MINIFLYKDFQSFLKDELQARTARNPKYSLRAFARDIGISFSRLSETLSSNLGISMRSAQLIADNLKMSDMEKEYFVNLIVAKHGRNQELRRKAKFLTKQHKTKRMFVKLRENHKELLSKWYYIPLVELLGMKKRKSISEIAGILDLSEEEVLAASLFLIEKGQIMRTEKGEWKKVHSFQKIESTTPTAIIRQFHQDILKRAIEAIDNQPIEKRKFLTSCFIIRKENLSAARQELERFSQDFLKKYTAEKSADAAYVFSLQLFGLE